jgi:hypothetical protein
VKAHRVVALIFCLESRLTDGGQVVSPKRLPPFTPQEDSWYSFLLEAESPQGHSAAGNIRKIEKMHFMWTRSRDIPVCSIGANVAIRCGSKNCTDEGTVFDSFNR